MKGDLIMGGAVVEKFWNLAFYRYPFYRFIIEKHFLQLKKESRHLMLDAGCGANICSLSKVLENVTVIGLDISKENIHSSHKAAKRRNYKNFHFIIGSLSNIPIRSNTFDICVCIDVLEHLPNKNNSIAEISRVCQSKAKFVGSTSNLLNPILMFDSVAPKILVKPITEKFAPGHYERHKRLTLKNLIQLLENHNFYIKDVSIVGFPPFQPWLYHYQKKKVPIYAYLWIIFDKLTNKRPLNLLKETIIFHAIKKE